MAEDNLPAVTEKDLATSGLPSLMKMSPGLALFFNDAVYARCKAIASHMAKAEGMMPRHLIGKPEACFAVISRAITWNLDPFSVAMATYQTPGGSIGYAGALIQAILENSGALEGGIKFEHGGDWSKVQGKFKIETSPKGGKYPVPLWGQKEAEGLYVIVSAQVKGELEPRTLKFELNEAFPLNSPLWATAPNRQIRYTSVRAFGNLVTPSLLMGVPFDVDPTGFYGEPMQDVTPPRPAKSDFVRKTEVTEVHDPVTGEILSSHDSGPVTVALQSEMHPEGDEPSGETPGPSADFAAAEETLRRMVQNMADVDDLEGYKKAASTNIASFEHLTDEERSALRGRFNSMILNEKKKRNLKGGKS